MFHDKIRGVIPHSATVPGRVIERISVLCVQRINTWVGTESPPLNGINPRQLESAPALTESTFVLTEPALILTEPALILTEPALTLTEPSLTLTEPALILTESALTLKPS